MPWPYDDLGNIGAQIGAYGSWPIGLGIGRPPGGYTGGYGLRPGGTPPSPGGAAPGAGLPTPQPVTPGAPNLGQIGAQIGAMGNWPSASGSAAWTPATVVPPGMAQYGLSPHSGLLGSLGGMGADVGRMGNWPNAQGTSPVDAAGGLGISRPPGGYTGGYEQPEAPPPVPQRKPAAVKPKPKPKPKVQAGNQARNTSWETHSEAYNPIQGTFGHQAWRTPKR